MARSIHAAAARHGPGARKIHSAEVVTVPTAIGQAPILRQYRDALRDHNKLPKAPMELFRDHAVDATRMIADLGEVSTPTDNRLWRELIAARPGAHTRAADEFQSDRRHSNLSDKALAGTLIHDGMIPDQLDRRRAVDAICACRPSIPHGSARTGRG